VEVEELSLVNELVPVTEKVFVELLVVVVVLDDPNKPEYIGGGINESV